MTYSKTTHRLIICDVDPSIVTQEGLRNYLKSKVPNLSALNIYYDRDRHLSMFIDYIPETKYLEITGTLKNFDVTADCVVSYKYKIAHSVFSSSEFILNWVIQRDAEYSSPKPESYDVF